MRLIWITLTVISLTSCNPKVDSQPTSQTLSSFTPNGSQVELRILETADLHGNMLNWDYYKAQEDNTVGFNKIATLIRSTRAENPNNILVDNGDLIQGNPLAEYVYRTRNNDTVNHCVYAAMNELGYDVGNYGNHEFNFGLDYLKNSVKGANFPYVNANVFIDDGDSDTSNDHHAFNPYVILHKTFRTTTGVDATVNIGVLGLTPPQIMVWDRDKLNGKIKTRDMVDVAQEMVPRMRADGADIIIAVPHSGMSADARNGGEENAANYLTLIDGIDAAMTGHSHAVFPRDKFYDSFPGADSKTGTFNGKPLVMPGMYGSHLGVVDLKIERDGDHWKVLSGKGSVRAIYESVVTPGQPAVIHSLVDADAIVNEKVAVDHRSAIAWMDTKIATTHAPITTYLALAQNDSAVQVMADAARWYAHSAISLPENMRQLPILAAMAPSKAGGRMGPNFYTAISAGDLRRRSVADIYGYSNELSILKLTGAEVREWLEMSAIGFNTIDPSLFTDQMLVKDTFKTYNLDTIAGLTYEYDVTQGPRYTEKGELVNATLHRVTSLQFNLAPVTDQQEFLVVTTSYRANGGGSFPGLTSNKIVYSATRSLQDIIADYLAAKQSISGNADRTWSFKAIHPVGKVILLTAPEAQSLPDFVQGYENLGIDGNGFLRAGLHL